MTFTSQRPELELSWHPGTSFTLSPVVCGCFHAMAAELSGCNMGHLAHLSMDHLAFHEKHRLTCDLGQIIHPSAFQLPFL